LTLTDPIRSVNAPLAAAGDEAALAVISLPQLIMPVKPLGGRQIV